MLVFNGPHTLAYHEFLHQLSSTPSLPFRLMFEWEERDGMETKSLLGAVWLRF